MKSCVQLYSAKSESSSFSSSLRALSLPSCLGTGQTGRMRGRYGCLAWFGCNLTNFLRLWDSLWRQQYLGDCTTNRICDASFSWKTKLAPHWLAQNDNDEACFWTDDKSNPSLFACNALTVLKSHQQWVAFSFEDVKLTRWQRKFWDSLHLLSYLICPKCRAQWTWCGYMYV